MGIRTKRFAFGILSGYYSILKGFKGCENSFQNLYTVCI